MIRLYDYWRSSASYRVRIALGLAGLEWETVSVDLVKGDQNAPAHLALNPQGLVPILEIDGLRFTQSLAIVEYLDETRRLGLLPEAPADRAHVRALAYAVAMDIHPVCNTRVVKQAVEKSLGNLATEEWMKANIAPGLAALERLVDDGRFSWGDRISLADICLVPQLYNARRWNVDLARMPKLRRIDTHLSALPAFAAAHPDNHRP